MNAINKTIIVLISVVTLFSCSATSKTEDDYNAFIRQADSLYMVGSYSEANIAFDNALKCKQFIQNSHLYNGACVASLAGDADKAFMRLNMRLKRDKDWYVDDPMRDKDLEPLHTDKRWDEYVAEMTQRKNRIESKYDKPLRAKLKDIGRADQEVRYAYIDALGRNDASAVDSLLKHMQYVDSINHVEICNILDTRGWVGKDVVGDACQVFWLIIQHASVESQRKYLPYFQEAVKRGEMHTSTVAMMEDRIAVFEGKPQKYGSQVYLSEDGKYTPFELLNADKVDEWRIEVGMQTLDDYLKGMNYR